MQIRNVSVTLEDGAITVSFEPSPAATYNAGDFTARIESLLEEGAKFFVAEIPTVNDDTLTFRFEETSRLPSTFDGLVEITFKGRTVFSRTVQPPASFDGPFSDGRITVPPEEQVDDYRPASTASVNARVYVNGIELPAGDVTVHARKEGPVDVGRYAEFQFASPWDGDDYADLLSTLNPVEQSQFDEVYIEGRDYASGNFYPVFRGVVTGVSSAPSVEQLWQGRARGPGLLLDKFPVSHTFRGSEDGLFPTIKTVYNFVLDTLNEKLPFTFGGDPTAESERWSGSVADQVPIEQPDSNPLILGANSPIPDIRLTGGSAPPDITTAKEFRVSEHTLADVVNWVNDRIGAFSWFTPTRDGVQYLLADRPTARRHFADYLGGSLYIEDNDALAQLQPENTLTVRGKTEQSAKNTYTVVEARHEPLYRRAGKRALYANVHEVVETNSVSELQQKAKRRLKKAIDAATDATMTTMAVTPINPFDTVEAKPTVDSTEATNTPSLTYEVHRVRHEFSATGLPRTVLNVGVHTDIEEDIVIVETTKQKV